MHQTVISHVCLEGQWYETVFDPVGLVVSRVDGVAILPTLAALPHSPLYKKISAWAFPWGKSWMRAYVGGEDTNRRLISS